METEIEKLMKEMYEIQEKIEQILIEKNNRDTCKCNSSDYYLHVDSNLLVTPYCLICGGMIPEVPFKSKKEKDNEIVTIPQIRERRRWRNYEGDVVLPLKNRKHLKRK